MLASSEIPIVFPEYEYKITQKDGKLFIYDVIVKQKIYKRSTNHLLLYVVHLIGCGLLIGLVS